MKRITFLSIAVCIAMSTYSQGRELTFYSSCYGPGLKSLSGNYNLGYSYDEKDSIVIISGNLGYENCGIEHIFSARIDSNRIILSETVIDSSLTTCDCYKSILIKIDHFCYGKFTVEFNGKYLAGVPNKKVYENIQVFPNPAYKKITIEFPNSSWAYDIEIVDITGRVLQSYKSKKERVIQIDVQGLKEGLYFVRIDDLKIVKVVIKN